MTFAACKFVIKNVLIANKHLGKNEIRMEGHSSV